MIQNKTTSFDQIDVLTVDWHGNLRGKRLPGTQTGKISNGDVRLPLSTQAQDIWNDDMDDLIGIGLSKGDPDGLCIPGDCAIIPQPWHTSYGQALTSLHNLDGSVSEYDVRGILMREVEAYRVSGLTPVVAVELEFYLLDAESRSSGQPLVPTQLGIAGKPRDLQLYDMRVMDRIDDVLRNIHAFSIAMGVPADTTLAEFGPGQFEINLKHRNNPLQAADDAILFKQLVDRAAYRSGLLASFMAKPYTQHGGSGQHIHVSVVNEQGQNILDSASSSEPILEYAVASCVDALAETQLVFAPNGNSYRRLQPDSFAPCRIDWGYDHRGVAVRIPENIGANARMEHRVAGADANPYLVIATILASIRRGLTRKVLPSTDPIMAGDTQSGPLLSHDWLTAIHRARESDLLKSVLGPTFVDHYTSIKQHEAEWFNQQVNSVDWDTYLSRV